MDLTVFEYNGGQYLFDSKSNRFWLLALNGNAINGTLVTDASLIMNLNREMERPAPIMPGEPGNA